MGRKILITVFACIICLYVTGQNRITINNKLIDQFMETEMSKWKVPGCAIAIVKGNDILSLLSD